MKRILALLALVTIASSEPPVQGYNYQAPTPSYQPPPDYQNNYNALSSSYGTPSASYIPPSNTYLPPNNYDDGSYSNDYDQGHYDNSQGHHDNGQGHHDHDQGHHGHGSDSEVPKSYEFGYSVKDAETGNDYGRRESSDGNVVRGEYRVQLPDGRTQIVTYHADWRTGFHADVRYEGEARYPQANHNNHNNKQNGGYNYNTPDFGGSLTGFHGNANVGYKQPSTAYGPPGYH